MWESEADVTIAQLKLSLIDLQYLVNLDDDTPIRLIIGGTAYDIVDVWWEAKQDGVGAICLGDDPR